MPNPNLTRQRAAERVEYLDRLQERLDELGVVAGHDARKAVNGNRAKLDQLSRASAELIPTDASVVRADDEYAAAVNVAQITIKGVEELNTREALARPTAADTRTPVSAPLPPSPPADAGGKNNNPKK